MNSVIQVNVNSNSVFDHIELTIKVTSKDMTRIIQVNENSNAVFAHS